MPAWKSLAYALNLALSRFPPPPAILASFNLTQKKNLFNSACACAVVARSRCQRGESPFGAGVERDLILSVAAGGGCESLVPSSSTLTASSLTCSCSERIWQGSARGRRRWQCCPLPCGVQGQRMRPACSLLPNGCRMHLCFPHQPMGLLVFRTGRREWDILVPWHREAGQEKAEPVPPTCW